MGAKTKYIPGAETKAAFRDLDAIRSLTQFSKLRHARSPRRRRLPVGRELEVQVLIEAWILDREAMPDAARDVLFDVVRDSTNYLIVAADPEKQRQQLADHLADVLGIDVDLAAELCEDATL